MSGSACWNRHSLISFSAVSHELKTPITVIKGQLEGMLLNVGKYKERDKCFSFCSNIKAQESNLGEEGTKIQSTVNPLRLDTNLC